MTISPWNVAVGELRQGSYGFPLEHHGEAGRGMIPTPPTSDAERDAAYYRGWAVTALAAKRDLELHRADTQERLQALLARVDSIILCCETTNEQPLGGGPPPPPPDF